MGRLIVIAAIGGAAGWLYTHGWCDPARITAAVARERERVPAQVKEALAAGKRAAAERERRFDLELSEALGNEAARGI